MRRFRFLAVFFALLFVLEISLLVDPIDRQVIRPFSSLVAAASGRLLRLSGQQVNISGTVIAGTCLAIDIHNGCNGVEAMMFVVAAVIAFPTSWPQRLVAALAGAIILQVANLIRVVTLYLVGCYHRTWFETFHLGIWQSLMFGIAVAFFVLWSRRTKLVHAP